jgi:hypothetical protein
MEVYDRYAHPIKSIQTKFHHFTRLFQVRVLPQMAITFFYDTLF